MPGGRLPIACFYSLFHIPREDQEAVFRKWFELLIPGGHAYFNLASAEYTGRPEFHRSMNFKGVALPYSHYRPEHYLAVLGRIGFQLLAGEKLTIGGETMLWLLIRRPA
jgi:hypothetical protein